jgi:hypothetical protein
VIQPGTHVVEASALCSGLALVEHLAVIRGSARRSVPRVVGATTLGFAFTWWAYRRQQHEAALAFWTIVAVGNTALSLHRWVLGILAEIRDEAFQAGQLAGRTAYEDTGRNRDRDSGG